MRALALLALCMAGAVALPAAGKTGQTATSAAPAKNVQAESVAPQDPRSRPGLIANNTANNAGQDVAAQAVPGPAAPAQIAPGGQNAPADVPPGSKMLSRMPRAFPQMPFDKGIYLGRNSLTGSKLCLAIQSYNFSQAAPGKMPQLESVTTCTSVTQPLMRQVRKPPVRKSGAQDQEDQEEPEGPK